MAETKRCSTCHRELPPNAPSGLCSRCLLQRALDESGITDVDPFIEDSSALDPASFHATAEDPARYAGQREYAHGGMGRILLAQDEQVGREVLIKELLPKRLEGAQETSAVGGQAVSASAGVRFLREARVTGQLEHPGVVPVYEIGYREDGTLFYTMKNVRGRSLLEAIHQAPDLEARLKLLPHLLDVCQAAAYAHSRGVIHRDIKPSNIMVGEFGETVLLDWGLAKVRDLGEPDELSVPTALDGPPPDDGLSQDATSDGQVLGTPAYMAPEQARGAVGELDERTDVYALGAALYTLLTGQAPFGGASRAEIIRSVLEDSPTRILYIVPNAPRELVAIAEKAMAKDSEDRYVSAGALADELRQYLSGGLVRAYEYNPAEHLVRFAGKHRTGVVAALACVVLLLAFASSAYVRTAKERDLAIEERDRAARAEYARTIPLAALRIERGEIGPALKLLQPCPSELRGWEWGHLVGQCHPEDRCVQSHTGSVTAFAVRGDRACFATAGEDGTVAVWRMPSLEEVWRQSGERSARALAFGPSGRRLAALMANGSVVVFDAETGTLLRALPPDDQRGEEKLGQALLFGQQGACLCVLDGGAVTVWNTADWHMAQRIEAMRVAEPMQLAWSSEGAVLVVVGREERSLQLEGFDLGSGVSVWFRERLALHESELGVVAQGYGEGKGLICHYGKSLYAYEMTPDGLAWRNELELPRERMANVTSLATLPDGSLAAVGQADGTVLVFSLQQEKLVGRTGTGEPITFLTFMKDDSVLVTADAAGQLKRIGYGLLDQVPNRLTFLERELGGVCNHLAFSPDSRYLAASNERVPEFLTVWDLETGARVRRRTPEGVGDYVAFVPGRGELLLASPGMLHFYDVEGWAPTRQVAVEGTVEGGAFDGAGHLLMAKFAGVPPRVLDLDTGEAVLSLDGVPALLVDNPYEASVALAPAGDLCAASSMGSDAVWVLHVPSGEVLHQYHREGARVSGAQALAFHPAGKLLAAGYNDGTVVLWGLETGAPLTSFDDPGRIFLCLAFSPDGRRLVTTTRPGHVRVWDWETGAELLSTRSVSSLSTDVAFSPDGHLLAFADANLATTQLLLGQDGGVRQGHWRRWSSDRAACRRNLLHLYEMALDGTSAQTPSPQGRGTPGSQHEDMALPTCPAGGAYVAGDVGEPPACTQHGSLQQDPTFLAEAFERAVQRGNVAARKATEARLEEALVDNPGYLNETAVLWSEEENRFHEAAVLLARRAVALVPGHGILLRNLAQAEQRAGHFDDAVQHFREAIEAGQDSRPRLAQTLALRAQPGDIEEACALLEAYLVTEPVDDDLEPVLQTLAKAAGDGPLAARVEALRGRAAQ